jgi:hypothetical protein
MQICPLLTGSWASAPISPPLHAQYTLFRQSLKRSSMCCLLASMVACVWVPCTFREWSRDMVHNNCLDYPENRTETRCNLLHDFTPLLRIASGGFGLVLGLCLGAGSLGCCPPCQIPRGLTLVPVPVTGRSPSPYRRPLQTKQKGGLEHFVVFGDGKGSHLMHLLLNALHRTLQARYLHRCQFELKQLGSTAAYRARQCLLTSRNTFISILRAGLLQPHGSESGTWHNHDLIRRHACADASPWSFDPHA